MGPKSFEVVFRDSARQDLYNLYMIILEGGGLQRASDYIDRIEKACMGLSTFPKRGTARGELAPGIRTVGFERRVTILFRVDQKTVEIVGIYYAGRNYEALYQDEAYTAMEIDPNTKSKHHLELMHLLNAISRITKGSNNVVKLAQAKNPNQQKRAKA